MLLINCEKKFGITLPPWLKITKKNYLHINRTNAMLRNYNNSQNQILTDSQKKIHREAPLQKCEFLWLAKLMINLSILYHLFSQISSCTTDIRLEDFPQS